MCINGTPMIQSVINEVMKVTSNIIIVANNAEYGKFGLPVLEDIYKDKGPLAGIYTGLSNSTTNYNLVLACDSPSISKSLIEQLISNIDGQDMIYSSLDKRIYPLTAIYNKSILPVIEKQLNQDELRVKDLVNLVNCKEVVLEDDFEEQLINLNTTEDLNLLLK